MTKVSLAALKKKAIERVPKLAPAIHNCFASNDFKWGDKVPTKEDIVSTLTCLINDLDPIEKNWTKAETGRLFASYEDHDEVIEIVFGVEISDYVMKAE